MNATKHRVRIPTAREFAYRLNRHTRESNLCAMLPATGTKVRAMTYPELELAAVR